jgi:hypothetical protein
MTNYKVPRINLEPNTKSLADGTNTLQPGRPPGISFTSLAPVEGKGNPGIYLGVRPFGVVINGVPHIGNFHLIEAIEGTWLSAATRKFGWGAVYGAEQGFGAYVKGIVLRMDGSFIWGLPEADRIEPGERFYIKIYEGKDEGTVSKRPELKLKADKRVSQIVYHHLWQWSIGQGGGKVDFGTLLEMATETAISLIQPTFEAGSLGAALNGEKIGDEKKRQYVKPSGDKLTKVDIGQYYEIEHKFGYEKKETTGWFNFHWGNSDNNNVIVNYTAIKVETGEKDASLYRMTETVDLDYLLNKQIDHLRAKVHNIDKGQQPQKITLNEARMTCPK